MPRYIGVHIFNPGEPDPETLEKFQAAALEDPQVLGYRTMCTHAGGKAMCILEAAGDQEVAQWFDKIGLSVDSISMVKTSKRQMVTA